MDECIRNISNFSSIELTDRFDKPSFNREKFLNKLKVYSPKLASLLININKIDEEDYNKSGKLYKHYIFSDLKRGYGAKIIASGLIAAGYTLVQKPQKGSIILDENLLKKRSDSKFAVLSSTALWEAPITEEQRRDILKNFNKRPDNVYGELFRIIVLDSGFKEGVDLFDVRYAHIFEDQLSEADLTQAIGRGTRFCGQKGLPFEKGWKLDVFNYKSYIKPKFFLNKKKKIMDIIKEHDKSLNFKVNLENSLLNIVKDSAIDKLLTKDIHKEHNKYLKYITYSVLGALSIGGLVAFSRALKRVK